MRYLVATFLIFIGSLILIAFGIAYLILTIADRGLNFIADVIADESGDEKKIN